MAEELRTVLGFDASQAIKTLESMTVALNIWSNAMNKAKSSAAGFNAGATGFEKAVQSSSKAITTSNKQSAASLDSLLQSTKNTYGKLSSVLPSIHPVMQQQGAAVKKLADEYKKSGADIVLTWKSVVRIFTIQVLHQVISQMTSAMREALKASRDYESSLAEIQTISAGAYTDLDQLATKVEELAEATGQKLPVVTAGLYQTLSNQVTSAANAFTFLATASDFSIAAVTSLDNAVNLLSSTLNSYKLSAVSADQVAGKLFKTIELGRIRGEELATSFGRVSVLSSQLGVSLDELLASIATLTRLGMQYNEAYTLITNVQLKLVSPTDKLKSVFKELGVTTAEAGIQAYGFQGFIQKIGETAGSTATELSELYGRIRAVRGALGLGAEYADTYNDSLEQIKKASAQTLQDAKKIIFETNAQQVELELNKLNVTMNQFGRNANSTLLQIFNAFGGSRQAMTALTTSVAAGAAVWLILRPNALNALKSIIASATILRTRIHEVGLKAAFTEGAFKKMASSPTLWATATVGAILLVNYALQSTIRIAKKAHDDLEKTLAVAQRQKLIKYDIEITEQANAHKQMLASIQQFLIEKQKLYESAAKDITIINSLIFNTLEDQVGNQANAIESLFTKFYDVVAETNSKLRDISIKSAEIAGSINDWSFERSLRSVDKYHEVYQRIARAESLRAESQRAAAKGEFEVANALQKRAEEQAKAAVSAADQTKNRSLIAKAEESALTTMKGQLDIQNKLKQNTIDQAQAVKDQLSSMNMLSARLKVLSEHFKDLTNQLSKTTDPVDRERISKELALVSKDLAKTFGDVKIYASLANKLQLQKEFAEATKGFFDPVTGEVQTFEAVVLTSLNRIRTAFADAFDTTEMQKTTAYLAKQLDQSTQAANQQAQAQANINDNIKLALASVQEFGAAIAGQTLFTKLMGDWDTSATHVAEKLKDEISGATQEAAALAAAGKANTGEYTAVLDRIIKIRDALATVEPYGPDYLSANFTNSVEALDKLITNLQTAATETKNVQEQSAQADILGALTQKITESKEPIEEYFRIIRESATDSGSTIGEEISTGASAANSSVQSNSDSMVSALKRVEQQARATAQALREASGAGAANKSRGGMMYLAGGGFAKRGTDTIPAMLSPGEFVVNADSTRKFFSQLVAINSGRSPVYRQSGGPVTNVTIGDIKITEAQSPSKTARDTVNEIRRELRRQSSSLKGYN